MLLEGLRDHLANYVAKIPRVFILIKRLQKVALLLMNRSRSLFSGMLEIPMLVKLFILLEAITLRRVTVLFMMGLKDSRELQAAPLLKIKSLLPVEGLVAELNSLL